MGPGLMGDCVGRWRVTGRMRRMEVAARSNRDAASLPTLGGWCWNPKKVTVLSSSPFSPVLSGAGTPKWCVFFLHLSHLSCLMLEPQKGDCPFFLHLSHLSLMLELEKVNTPFFTWVFHLPFWCWNSSFCFHVLAICSSPWYNCPVWLCIKNQVTYSW